MDIRAAVRQFITDNYLRGEHSRNLQDTTPLISSGIMDSIDVLRLVSFIETRFDVEFVPREIGLHSLETVEQIHQAIQKKLESKSAVPPATC